MQNIEVLTLSVTFFMFKLFKRKIKLESFEVRIIINSLKAMRNKLIENNEDTEYVDEILLKYLCVLDKM